MPERLRTFALVASHHQSKKQSPLCDLGVCGEDNEYCAFLSRALLFMIVVLQPSGYIVLDEDEKWESPLDQSLLSSAGLRRIVWDL
jgi:hypothetical protein